MKIPLLAGRDVTDADTPDKDPVAVINETFARQIYPGDNPIGRKFILNLGNDKPHEIIGVVGDVKLVTLDGEIRPTAYLSSRQYAFGLMTFVVRTTGDPALLGPGRGPRDSARSIRCCRCRPCGRSTRCSRNRSRGRGLTAVAMSIFAGGGAAARRARRLRHRRVFGVAALARVRHSRGARRAARANHRHGRRAEPAHRRDWGWASGLVAAIPATRLLRGLLFQVGPNDPMTFVGDRRDARGRRGRRVVPSRAPRHAGRSGGDVEGGMRACGLRASGCSYSA